MIHNPTPETIRQKERIIYEMTELMKDNPENISLYIEDMILLYTKDQMNEYEKIVFNDYGIEHPEEIAWNSYTQYTTLSKKEIMVHHMI